MTCTAVFMPLLQFVYRSLVDFIRRLYKHPVLAAQAGYHATARSATGDICDFQDGSMYEEAMKDPRFRSDPRNLLLGVITDGIQPHKQVQGYSMWPFLVTLFNLPPWMRYKLAVTTLLGIQAGSKSKRQYFSLSPVMQIIMDELKLLEHGVRVWDAHKQEWFTCHAKLVQVSSSPGQAWHPVPPTR
jgi:hypothetical protein